MLFQSVLCIKDSPERKPVMSHGLKMPSTNLEDQTLHLTVRLQAGDDEEEEQDEEISGLINSDGEVVEWDASKYLHCNSMFSAKAQSNNKKRKIYIHDEDYLSWQLSESEPAVDFFQETVPTEALMVWKMLSLAR